MGDRNLSHLEMIATSIDWVERFLSKNYNKDNYLV
jgi:hypothetical protein